MDELAEKRVFDARIAARILYLACDIGLISLSIAADRIGQFGLRERCSARDIITIDETILVATADVVLLGDGESFRTLELAHPPAAIGRDGEHGVIGDDRGTIYTIDLETCQLHHRGAVEATIVALDGPFVATTSGVYRWWNGSFDSAGLGDATAVTASPIPMIGTTNGLYRLANGWVRDLDASVTALSRPVDTDRHVLAATTDALYHMNGGQWVQIPCPLDGTITALTMVDTDPLTMVACTEDGTVGARAIGSDQPWTTQAIGVDGVRAIALGP